MPPLSTTNNLHHNNNRLLLVDVLPVDNVPSRSWCRPLLACLLLLLSNYPLIRFDGLTANCFAFLARPRGRRSSRRTQQSPAYRRLPMDNGAGQNFHKNRPDGSHIWRKWRENCPENWPDVRHRSAVVASHRLRPKMAAKRWRKRPSRSTWRKNAPKNAVPKCVPGQHWDVICTQMGRCYGNKLAIRTGPDRQPPD